MLTSHKIDSRIGAKLAENGVSLPSVIHGLTASNVVKVLSECGCECSVMGCLKGGSGENHQFDFLGRKVGERLVITGFESNDASSEELDMVNLRVKTLDSNPNTTMVVLQSKSPPRLRLIA